MRYHFRLNSWNKLYADLNPNGLGLNIGLSAQLAAGGSQTIDLIGYTASWSLMVVSGRSEGLMSRMVVFFLMWFCSPNIFVWCWLSVGEGLGRVRVGSCFVCLFVRLIMILHRCKEARVNELILWLLAWWRGLMCICVPYTVSFLPEPIEWMQFMNYLHHVVIGLFVRHNMCIVCFKICDLTCFHSGQERQKVMAATAANIERSVGRFKDRPGWFSPQGLSDGRSTPVEKWGPLLPNGDGETLLLTWSGYKQLTLW